MHAPAGPAAPVLGRYILHDEIASGGMATVHLGRLLGPAGFSKTVAIKRLHPQMAKDPEFVSMFLDEARLASRIQHPNAVTTLDIIAENDELFLVMEYIPGESLSRLLRLSVERGFTVDPAVMNTILSGALHGLHAAHEARDAKGEPMHIVHRDVSPQNILVGTDGVARVLDFGVAKAAMRLQTTRDGKMKGKIAYMAPEQLRAEAVDRRADIFAAGIVHWEALTGRRLFSGSDVGEVISKVLSAQILPPSAVVSGISEDLDDLVMKALERDAGRRYASAREYAIAIENAGPMLLPRLVGEWVTRIGGETLSRRSEKVALVERMTSEHEFSSGEKLIEARALLQSDPRAFAAKGFSALGERRPEPSTAGEVATVAVGPVRLPPPPSRRRVLPAALAGSVLLLGVGLAWALIGREPTPSPVLAPEVAAPKPPAAVAAETPPPAVVTAAPSATATAVASAKPASAHRAVRPVTTAGRRDCNPPYTVDSRGIRRVKPGCQ
jgi:serine/threonine-protein kinase